MSTVKTTNLQHPSAASPAIVLDADGGATVSGMGLVLVSPTSIANSGGSASASGGEVTFTGVSSVSLNGVFTSAYDNYRIMLTSNLSSSGTDASFRLRVSGSDNTTSNSYISQRLSASSTLVGGVRTTSNTWAIWQLNSTRINGIVFDIFNPFVNGTTAVQSVVASSDTGAYFATYVGTHTQSASYDGFTIYPDLNNITGTIRVYGYKNS